LQNEINYITSPSRGQYLRIETIGRKSGKPHQVIVRYVVYGAKVVIFPMRGKIIHQHWVMNIGREPRVKLYLDDKVLSGSAKIQRISGTDDPILPVFTRKYGSDIVTRYYKGQHNYIEILLDADYTPIASDDLVYGDLEAAFDGVAIDYDHHIFGNAINTWLRNVSVGLLTSTFKPGDNVIEIGCGTGTETLALAKRGIKVTACDVSSRMLEVLTKKARAAGLSDNITPIHTKSSLDLERTVKAAIGGLQLDGGYSTYGAINTEPNLRPMFRALNALLKQDSRLILGVWNKYCLYEIAGYSMRLKPNLAFARFRNPVPVGKSRFCVASNAYSVHSLDKFLNPYFALEKLYGVVITLPPSNLVKYSPKGMMLRFCEKLDWQLGSVFPLNRLGDHFLALYRSKGDVDSLK
jgi:SAM-dependent methyltransferase